MTVTNLTKNTVLALEAELADTPVRRMRGLLGRDDLANGQALVITHCNSIHMFFMKFPIDAVFVDHSGCVTGCVRQIQPFRLSPVFWKASLVIELPAGKIDATSTAIGDVIAIR